MTLWRKTKRVSLYVFHRKHRRLSKKKSITALCMEAGSIMPQIFLPGICLILSQVSLPVEICRVIRQFTVELNCSYSHKGFPNPLLSPCCHLHPALLIVSAMDRESKVLPFPLQLLLST